jgi:long-chain acyl-CoA synthetase
MDKSLTLTMPDIIQASVSRFPERPVLAYVDEAPLTYKGLQHKINQVIRFLTEAGFKKGDKIAILSQNMPNWGVAYMAIASMGAVVVPMLPEFSNEEINNVLEHSEAVGIFVSDRFLHKVNSTGLKTINIETFEMHDGSLKAETFTADEGLFMSFGVKPEDMASIIYTSGTTGKQKGVMLSHKNICFDAHKARVVQPIMESDSFLSILPLSHAYENTLGFVLPIIGGACVYYLKQPLAPAILVDALKKVQPTTILTVPLIIEKMYRGKILPAIKEKAIVRFLYKIPYFRIKINEKAGAKLMETFGGKLTFFGVGGSKLDAVVEQFLREAKFPVAIGYGLTEAAPMLAGSNPQNGKLQSTGPQIEDIELKLVGADKPGEQGEVWARGPNIMMGYYKDPNLTAETITPDGWLKTGDLAAYDKDGFIFIKGRIKNTILGANGENIYPEEIESLINNFKHVVESVVVEQKGKLVALVHFNQEELEKAYRQMYGEMTEKLEHQIEELKKELQQHVNARVNKFSRLQKVVVQHEPFQKTATQKIKRYLYNQDFAM